eukprot:224143_1
MGNKQDVSITANIPNKTTIPRNILEAPKLKPTKLKTNNMYNLSRNSIATEKQSFDSGSITPCSALSTVKNRNNKCKHTQSFELPNKSYLSIHYPNTRHSTFDNQYHTTPSASYSNSNNVTVSQKTISSLNLFPIVNKQQSWSSISNPYSKSGDISHSSDSISNVEWILYLDKMDKIKLNDTHINEEEIVSEPSPSPAESMCSYHNTNYKKMSINQSSTEILENNEVCIIKIK